MVELINYIEKLILTHNCVIIPELGGFVVRQRQAQIQGNEHLIVPPGKEIGFNAELKHNDGLLAEMFMKGHQVDYPTACIMLEKDVSALKTRLNEKRNVNLGKVGRLFLNERSVIQFESSAELIFPEYYGLAPFRCVELRYLEQPKSISLVPKEKEEYIHIRIQRSFVRQIAAFAAAVVLFVLISTPVKNPATDYASILYASNEGSRKPVIESPENVITPLIVETQDALPATDSTLLKPKAEPVVSQPKASEPMQDLTPAKHTGRCYYIVVGSVETIKAAERQIADQKAKGFTKAGYIDRDNRVRVYVDSFTDKKLGEQAVIDFRKAHPEHTDAWLFSAR